MSPAKPSDRMQSPARPRSLVALRPGGAATPLFCIHGLGGHVLGFLPLARGLEAGRPVYGLQAQGLEPGEQPHDRIESMAAFYLKAIRETQPRGPYLLAGWSLGGLIAMEAARQLNAAGESVALLAMFDTWLSIAGSAAKDLDDRPVMEWIAAHLSLSVDDLKKLPLARRWARIAEQAGRVEGIVAADIGRLAATCQAHLAAAASYTPVSYAGRVVLFQPADARHGADRQWRSLCPRLQVEPAAGNHYTMLRKPEVDILIRRLGHYLHEIAENGATVNG
ncbi:MAG: alpha/beta fold hydrolase [Thermoguttaceae bacterium]